ncbi:MAG: sulfatase-like hydrolase/transferase [Candidatus Eisenbacteria bacterium]
MILAVAATLPGGCGPEERFPGVNLILITIDTMRSDHLASYGRPNARTPHMDRLAREGTLFTRMYASAPLTLPSHTTFLTGRYPSSHGVHDNGAYRFGEEGTTIAEYLSGAGYRTAAFVSSFQLDRKYGLAQGFREYDDRMPQKFEVYDPRIAAGPKADSIRHQSGQRRAEEITALVTAWLGRGGSEPFFLWLHYFDPHESYDPPPPFDRMNQDLPFPDSLYDGEIAYLDRELGRLIGELEDRGIYDRCLVLLSADHGEGLGSHGERYHDTFIYDSTIRIPFLVGGGAAKRNAPRFVETPVRSIDVLPTLLDAAGVKPKGDVQGESLLPLLEGEERRGEWTSYAETFSPIHNLCSKLFSIRTEEWKYIEAPLPELYRVSEDPGERTNLIERRPEVALDLREILKEHMPEEETGRIEIDEETREKLEAIGYVRGEAGPEAVVEGKDPKEILPCTDGLHLSMLHFTYGRYDSSLAVLERLKLECPPHGQIYDNIGNLRIRLGHYEETIEEFTEIIRLHPSYSKGYFWVGMAYLRTGRDAEALEWFRKAVERDPNMQIAQYNVGLALGNMRRVDEALEAWEEAIRISPNSTIGRLAKRAYDDVASALEQSRRGAGPVRPGG